MDVIDMPNVDDEVKVNPIPVGGLTAPEKGIEELKRRLLEEQRITVALAVQDLNALFEKHSVRFSFWGVSPSDARVPLAEILPAGWNVLINIVPK